MMEPILLRYPSALPEYPTPIEDSKDLSFGSQLFHLQWNNQVTFNELIFENALGRARFSAEVGRIGWLRGHLVEARKALLAEQEFPASERRETPAMLHKGLKAFFFAHEANALSREGLENFLNKSPDCGFLGVEGDSCRALQAELEQARSLAQEHGLPFDAKPILSRLLNRYLQGVAVQIKTSRHEALLTQDSALIDLLQHYTDEENQKDPKVRSEVEAATTLHLNFLEKVAEEGDYPGVVLGLLRAQDIGLPIPPEKGLALANLSWEKFERVLVRRAESALASCDFAALDQTIDTLDQWSQSSIPKRNIRSELWENIDKQMLRLLREKRCGGISQK